MGHTNKKSLEVTKCYDFVIVGSGIAGLMSALYASEKGKVLLVTKSELKASNTWYAQGGVAAAVSINDSFKKHIADTIKAGHGLNDKKAVKFIIKSAPKAIEELEQFGIKFAHQPIQHRVNQPSSKNYDLKLEGGHSEKRVLYYKDKVGQSIENNLIKQVKKNDNITIKTNCFAVDLILDEAGKKCTGLKYIANSNNQKTFGTDTSYKGGQRQNRKKNNDTATPELVSIHSKRIVLCTGGTGQIFSKTTNPSVATGDGIAMAARAGSKLKGMEFVQFHPTALVNSTAKIKNNSDKHALNENPPLFLLSETLRGEGAVLLNHKKERFMIKKHPLAELAARDVISKAIFNQQKKGPVFMDLRAIPLKTLKNKYPAIFNKLKKEKIPYNKPIKITPAAHYLCGGVATDIFGRTSIQNLYAIGECANTGLHGANRLASNSLLEAATMSRQVTKKPLPKTICIPKTKSANRINKTSFNNDKTEKQFTIPESTNTVRNAFSAQQISKIVDFREKIQTIMTEKCGIIRKRKDMDSAKKEIQTILSELHSHNKTQFNTYLVETINLTETALIILTAALKRKKSSGCHITTA